MKIPILNFGLLLSATLNVQAATAASAQREAFCGAYLTKVCYPIDQVEEHTMKYPADFSIDEVDLRNGPRVTLYEGIGLSEQEGVHDLNKSKSFQVPSGTIDVYTGSSNLGTYYDVHFNPSGGKWGVLQIFGYLKSSGDAAAVGKFISELHPCKYEQLAVTCRAEWPFEEAGASLASVATPNAQKRDEPH